MHDQPDNLTVLLNQAQAGDRDAAQRAWSRIYDELRMVAAGFASKESGQVEATSVLLDAYLRTQSNERWDNRRHFFGAMRQAMSRVLIDRGRRRGARPDLQPARRVELRLESGELADLDTAEAAEEVGLFDALEILEREDPEAAEVTRLRYIRGLTIEQTAEQLGVSAGTVKNRWRAARAWLREHVAAASGRGDAIGAEPDRSGEPGSR